MLYWLHHEILETTSDIYHKRTKAMAVIIRTITVGVGEPHPLSDAALDRAVKVLQAGAKVLRDAGYDVQTLRVSTRPLFHDRLHARDAEIVNYATTLQERCEKRNIEFLSLGPVMADDPQLPLARIGLLPDMLGPNDALNASVQIASVTHGIRQDAAVPTARVVQALSHMTPRGIGNLRFAMSACAPQRGPFFPAAYQPDSDWGFSIGLQSARLVTETIQATVRETRPGPEALAPLVQRLVTALEREGRVIADAATRVAREQNTPFFGLDLSPAPNGPESIAEAIESVGLGQFGEPGTLIVAAAITSALKNTALKTCGYNGLFLPVLEDAVIAQRIATNNISVPALLLYSSVCGAGLDTIPIAGDTPLERIAATMLDVATLATQLKKPLSTRLMPVIGHTFGERSTFDSPWLTNAPIMAV
jgi:uncharacterized protein